MLSIIIPTLNEQQNVPLLVRRITQSLQGVYPFEIIFVDDSTDGTPAVIEEMARIEPRIRLIHRQKERGLATAVVRGFAEARGDIFAVLDADLQHPPELLPQMLAGIFQGYDLVISSRFVPGGKDAALSLWRKGLSWSARMMSRFLLSAIRPCQDPTSGYFMLRRSVIEQVELQPLGWKILMEILVRGNYERMVEIPYVFKPRREGRSKLGWQEQVQYVRHLLRLSRVNGVRVKGRLQKS